MYTKLQSFIPLLLNLMNLCHIICAHPENFLFLLESPLYGHHCKVWMATRFTRF